jgi:hypothetical protein
MVIKKIMISNKGKDNNEDEVYLRIYENTPKTKIEKSEIED